MADYERLFDARAEMHQRLLWRNWYSRVRDYVFRAAPRGVIRYAPEVEAILNPKKKEG